MKTDALINLLAEDRRTGWPLERTFALAALGGIAVAAAAFLLCIGVRPDIAQAMHSARFLFKFIVTITLAVGATGAALAVGRPEAAITRWLFVLLAVPALLGGAVGLELSVTPESAWIIRLVGHNSRSCLTIIPLLAIGPLICLFVALRRGATTRPRLAGALLGLAASGISATFYAANCTDDSPLFVATWYPLATAMVVAVGTFAGARLLRW